MNLAESPHSDKMEVTRPVTKQKVLLGQLRPQPGQKVWEMNLVDYSVKEAVLTQNDAELKKDGTTKAKKSINVKENHIYCVAINLKNAEKKFVKRVEKQMELYYQKQYSNGQSRSEHNGV